MKTLTGWNESGQELTPFLQPGDEVEEAFSDWALNLQLRPDWRTSQPSRRTPHIRHRLPRGAQMVLRRVLPPGKDRGALPPHEGVNRP